MKNKLLPSATTICNTCCCSLESRSFCLTFSDLLALAPAIDDDVEALDSSDMDRFVALKPPQMRQVSNRRKRSRLTSYYPQPKAQDVSKRSPSTLVQVLPPINHDHRQRLPRVSTCCTMQHCRTRLMKGWWMARTPEGLLAARRGSPLDVSLWLPRRGWRRVCVWV